LRGDTVCPPGGILDAEHLDVVAEFGQRRGRAGPGETCADDKDLELPLIGGIHELRFEDPRIPLLLDRPVWNPRVKRLFSNGGHSVVDFQKQSTRATTPEASSTRGRSTLPGPGPSSRHRQEPTAAEPARRTSRSRSGYSKIRRQSQRQTPVPVD